MRWDPMIDESMAPLDWYDRWLDAQIDAASEHLGEASEPDREPPEEENQP